MTARYFTLTLSGAPRVGESARLADYGDRQLTLEAAPAVGIIPQGRDAGSPCLSLPTRQGLCGVIGGAIDTWGAFGRVLSEIERSPAPVVILPTIAPGPGDVALVIPPSLLPAVRECVARAGDLLKAVPLAGTEGRA